MMMKSAKAWSTWALVFSPAPIFLLGVQACPTGVQTQSIPMRDGVELMTDVYEARGGQAAPTIVIRTPYTRASNEGAATTLSSQGYSVTSQDIRGTGDSEGTFLMFLDDGFGGNQDGYDTVEWSTSGAWSNGRACLYGGSALAITSLLAAGAAPPSLVCGFSLVGTGDIFHHALYQGGALRYELAVNWLNGLGAPEALEMVYDHPCDDGTWDAVALQKRYGTTSAAFYHMGGWYDIFGQGTLNAFEGMQVYGGTGAAGQQKLLMGPWTHGGTAGELVYPDSAVPSGEELRWFNYWLQGRDDGIGSEPAVKYYLMGDPTDAAAPGNQWLTSSAWPVAHTPTPFYLHEGGLLLSELPSGAKAPAKFVFDPANPVPTLGGPNLYLEAGSYDQAETLDRADVLVYQTAVLEAPLTITGRVEAHLIVASSALDTDFTVKLMDVYPDGRFMLVCDGIVRMRFRDGQLEEQMMIPGETYEVDVDLWSTALAFNRGHRVAVAISSSNSPRFDVNPNTGGPLNEPQESVVAYQEVYQTADAASYILLPVVAP